MTAPVLALAPFPRPRRRAPNLWVAGLAVGFLYWLAFLLLLEPGNLLAAAAGGYALDWRYETLRILVAALMGASVTPALLMLTRRWPVEGPRLLPRAALHGVAIAAMAAGLIVASCFVAHWVKGAGLVPGPREVAGELSANWALLVYCMAAFTAAAHVLRARRRNAAAEPAPEPVVLGRIAVVSRGRAAFVEAADIDWVETQGNYVALYTAGACHLVREPLSRFEARLDPARFVRAHRRIVVAADRVRAMRPLANGDALLTLADGRELRCSRSYRAALAARLLPRE